MTMIKTSEFIKMLLEEDPNDECYVCVGNHPVRWLEKLPYYYDGRMEWIERDKDTNQPIKAGYKSGEMKLKIHYDTLEDVFLDHPDVELELSGITYQGKVQGHYYDAIEEWQKEGREFQEWRRQCDEARKNGKEMPSIHIQSTPEKLQDRIHTWFRKLGLIK